MKAGRRALFLLGAVPAVALAVGALAAGAGNSAARTGGGDAARARQEIRAAQAQSAAASARAQQLEARARAATQQADVTAHKAAVLAARVQQTEADLAVQEARITLIAGAQADLRARLAARQAPLVRLTASLQRLSRRPPVLALLRPGSVQETVYMRALLETMLPEVERRTAGLRAEIARGRALEESARLAAGRLRESETRLREKRRELAAVEAQQRLAARSTRAIANREADRALALAERARDLGDLVSEIGKEGQLRDALGRLPGPVMRPDRPQDARVADAGHAASPAARMPGWILPLNGQLLTGFGEARQGEARTSGLVLAARPHAQAVAPAPGRIAFAGPYRGYGRIVIVEHDGGWASLVTGLARLDVVVGQSVLAGSPLGRTGPAPSRIGIELRRQGEPVNPLQYLRRP